MARIDLPVLPARNPQVRASPGSAVDHDRRFGAAVEHTRDAYRDVPILQEPTWGNEIAAYFYLGGLSSGAAILGSLATLVGGQERQTLARTAYYTAFATMLPCPVLLISDLGKPSRFHHMLRIFKPSSPMNFGAWVLTVHGAVATTGALRALAAEHKVPLLGGLIKLLPPAMPAVLGVPAALGLGGYTGVLIGTTSVPVWFTSPLLGGLFMASALNTGVAATSLAGALTGREQPCDRRRLASMDRTLGMAELALAGGYLATSQGAVEPLLRGKTRLALAGAGAASALSIALNAVSPGAGRGARGRGVAASVLALAGGALLRWSIVLAGRASARDRPGTLKAMSPSPRAPGWFKRGSRHG